MDKKNEVTPQQNAKRKFFFVSAAVLLLLFALFFAGAAVVSTALKNALVTELQELSGENISIHDLRLNPFPLSVEARGMLISSNGGTEIASADRVKGYVALSGLLNRTVSIRRLTLRDLQIKAERQKIEEMARHIKAALDKDSQNAFKVKIKAVQIVSGGIQISDDSLKGIVKMKKLSGEMITGRTQRITTEVKELTVQREGWPELVCDINTALNLKGDSIDIKLLRIGAFGSVFRGEGTYTQGKGTIKTALSLMVNSVKRFFGLHGKGDGQITAEGEVRIKPYERSIPSLRAEQLGPSLQLQQGTREFPRLKDVFVNMRLEGNFAIETLMELLHVKERIEGLVDFDGEITGPLTEITGRTRARLQKGNLFTVDVDSLDCTVLYRKGVLEFRNGSAVLYNGTAEAEAVLHFPTSDGYAVNVQAHSVDSSGVFKLINWDPGVPNGKVDGELVTTGTQFSPEGWFLYRNPSATQRIRKTDAPLKTDDVMNRIIDLAGNYSLRNRLLSLSGVKINTALSHITSEGIIDLEHKTLNMRSTLMTEAVSDLTQPYYREVEGHGVFSGEIGGTFADPSISGKLTLSNVILEEYGLDTAIAEFSYRPNKLSLRNAAFRSPGEKHTIKGIIAFPHATRLFDLSMPTYDLSAVLKKADFGKAVRIFSRQFTGSGSLTADFSLRGKSKDIEISGKASVERGLLYGVSFDAASARIAYKEEELFLKELILSKGQSSLAADGKLGPDKRFSYRASSDRLLLRDFGLERMPDDALISLKSEGSGTFADPSIVLNAKIAGGTFKGRNMGTGTVDAKIEDRNISVQAALFNEKMKLTGRGYLDERLPWTAEVVIQPARYDFLASSVLKDVPEDLQLNLEGKGEMKGDRHNVEVSARIYHLALSLFGQSFANESEIQFAVRNQKISFYPFAIRSGETSFNVRGGLDIGSEYDIQLEGRSALSPLKGLSNNIGYLKGDADFVVAVRGKWEEPEIEGSMRVSDASFGLKGYAAYMSSINGYLYIDEDRIVIEKLTGKFGGGTVDISGFATLKGFSMKRFYLDARLDNITAKIMRDFSINLDGNLLYRGNPDAMNITGDVRINKARFREPVEWRSWLLKARAIEKAKSEMSVFERAELNIEVSGSENISVDNNIARAPIRIRGKMVVKGTVSNPVLYGRVESNEGYIYFRNNEFRIIHVSADFTNPHKIKPVLNVTAEISIKGYAIRLNLEGETDRFHLSLSSDPPLEEVDILSLLTVGQLGKQTKGLEGGIGAGTATSFIAGKQQDIIEERIRKLTGIDRFQVEPYVSKSTGTVEPRVTVSERLIGDKVFVTYTTSIGSTEEQILKVEYMLNKNISLIGTRDDIGSVGGDVKFRFEFK